MRKVNNKKAIRRLSDRSFRASRTRNIIAVIAIALTAMLFTTIFTIGLGAMETFQQATMRQAGGDSHGRIKNLTEEQYDDLKDHPLIRESAPNRNLADDVLNPEFLKRHVEFWYVPEYHYRHRFIEIKEGKAPVKADEVLVDETTLELLGLPEKVGETITLTLQLGQNEPQITDRSFTISGIIRSDPALNVGFVIASEAYLSAYEEELASYEGDSGSLVGDIQMDVNFANSFGIQDKLNQVITESGYSVNREDPDYLANNANWAYLSEGVQADPMTVAAVAAGVFIILLTGYLIIYNVFQISVIRDIRYYGLLKTIGTTGRQVKRIVRRQAWKLAVMGIPFGLIAGYLIGKGIVPVVVERSAYAGTQVEVSLNPLIFIGSVLFSLITVWISTRKPAKIAGSVSPVEAVRYTERERKTGREKHSTDGGKIWRMALSNLGRSKQRTAVVILSMSLAVILLNSVFTVTSSFSMDQFLKRFVTSDFLIANARYFNNEYFGDTTTISEYSLSESFIEACESQDGFERGGRIYMTGLAGLDPDTYEPTENVLQDENGEFYWMMGSEKIPYNRDPEGNYMSAFYGMEDYPLEQLEVWEGETDLDVIKEKLATGAYLLGAVSIDDNGKVEEDEVAYRVGDHITLTGADGEKHEFEILSLVKENYYGLTNRMSNHFSFYSTADVFQQMYPKELLMSFLFDVEDGKEEEVGEFIENYTNDSEPMMHYESRDRYESEFAGMTGMFQLIGGVLTAVIGLIGILNFMNSTLTSIVTRRREFAMMEAIGMTKRQLIRMLMLEGTYYALLTIAASAVFGSLLSVTLVRMIADGMWFMEYHFIIWPMLSVFPLLLILGILVPYMAYLPQKKESVVSIISREI